MNTSLGLDQADRPTERQEITINLGQDADRCWGLSTKLGAFFCSEFFSFPLSGNSLCGRSIHISAKEDDIKVGFP